MEVVVFIVSIPLSKRRTNAVEMEVTEVAGYARRRRGGALTAMTPALL